MSESEHADSNAVAFLRAVKEHWLTLMSGGVITVALGIIERLSGKNVPLWAYAIIVLAFVVLACYLAFRDEHQKGVGSNTGERRREFLAQRLTQLLKEAAEVDFGAVQIGGGRGIGALTRSANHHGRVRSFLEAHWDAAYRQTVRGRRKSSAGSIVSRRLERGPERENESCDRRSETGDQSRRSHLRLDRGDECAGAARTA